MSAPEAAVAAVMEVLGCVRRSVGELGFCSPHWQMTSYTAWTDRGCPVAVAAADAAVDAARPGIRAETLEYLQSVSANVRAARARADRIEGDHG